MPTLPTYWFIRSYCFWGITKIILLDNVLWIYINNGKKYKISNSKSSANFVKKEKSYISVSSKNLNFADDLREKNKIVNNPSNPLYLCA